MKKLLKRLIIVMISLGLFSCKVLETELKKEVNQNRKEELITLAATGNYISSVEEMESGIKALYTCDINTRSAKADEIELSILDKIQLDTNMENVSVRSAAIAKEADSEFYIYNIENKTKRKNGYAIASTDRRIGNVIALVEQGTFEKDITNNPYLQIFLENLENYINETATIWNSITEKEIRSAATTFFESENYRYSDWKWNSGNNRYIMKTKWNQGNWGYDHYADAIQYYYGNCLNEKYGAGYIVGCGAVAIAQICAFHNKPTYISTNNYNKLSGWPVLILSNGNKWDGKYNWDEMVSKPYNEDLSSDYQMMVESLMFDVAESCNSNYKYFLDKYDNLKYSTSTNSQDRINYLKSIGYKMNEEEDYEFESVKNSIDNGCPVIVSAKAYKTVTMQQKKFLWWTWEKELISYSGGHAWVIDVYANLTCTVTNGKDVQTITDNFVHCNYGWGGSNDGYYLSGVFDTRKDAPYTGRSTEGVEGILAYYQRIVTNIN